MIVIDRLATRPRSFIWITALLLNLIIGVIDYLTGAEIGVGLLYLMPIGLLSWLVDRKAGIVMSAICTVTIISTQFLAGFVIQNVFIRIWDVLIHFGFFTVVAYLASALACDIAKRQHAEKVLQERVKELNCIYSIADLIEKTDRIEEIFQGTADLMTYGWYYPEMTCARITFKDQEFKTENFKETAWRMSSNIIVQRKPAGKVDVGYLEERPDRDEGPFLKEERFLLNSIAKRMGKVAERKQYEKEREGLIAELQQALSEVKKLSGLLPICASCKNIRNDEGYWEQIEGYIRQHSEAEFSHGICPECAKKLYPEFYEKMTE